MFRHLKSPWEHQNHRVLPAALQGLKELILRGANASKLVQSFEHELKIAFQALFCINSNYFCKWLLWTKSGREETGRNKASHSLWLGDMSGEGKRKKQTPEILTCDLQVETRSCLGKVFFFPSLSSFPPSLPPFLFLFPFLFSSRLFLAFLSFFFHFFLFRAAPAANGSSWAKGWIGAAAASLHHSHSNARSELHLWPTLQLAATPDPLKHWARPGIESASPWILDGFLTCWATMGTPGLSFWTEKEQWGSGLHDSGRTAGSKG